MTDNKTLLAHLALKFSDRTEDIAVEALGYILLESEPARRALQNLLRSGGAALGPISGDVRTQASGEDGAIPDLVCRDMAGVERVLIEAKFGAGLTENQPVAYIERLPADKPSALLFVAPGARFETLWHELRRLVNESEIELGADTTKHDLQSAAVGGQRRLMLTSWRHLLDRMVREAGAAGDSRAETDIRQLLGLTQRMDDDIFLPIRPEELGPNIPRRILSLQRIINDVTERGRSAGWMDTSGLSTSPSVGGWGRYMRLGHIDRAGALFGYSFGFWAKRRATPLYLRFQEWEMSLQEVRRRLERLQQEDPPGIVEGDGELHIPIYPPVGVEETAVVDAVVARLEYIARLIDPVGFDKAPSQR